MEKEITAADLRQTLIELPDKIFIIDLMSKEDFAANHVPGAVNIPVEELEDRAAEIPKDKNVVVVCRRGLMKSDVALEQLNELGINAKKLTGGTTNWFESLK